MLNILSKHTSSIQELNSRHGLPTGLLLLTGSPLLPVHWLCRHGFRGWLCLSASLGGKSNVGQSIKPCQNQVLLARLKHWGNVLHGSARVIWSIVYRYKHLWSRESYLAASLKHSKPLRTMGILHQSHQGFNAFPLHRQKPGAFRWERRTMRFEGILYNMRQPQG